MSSIRIALASLVSQHKEETFIITVQHGKKPAKFREVGHVSMDYNAAESIKGQIKAGKFGLV